ncbi:MAG: hypothetical protein ACLSBB_14560 [Ruthenibacterium lactatiformans]
MVTYPLFATVGPLIGFIRGTGNVEASLLVGSSQFVLPRSGVVPVLPVDGVPGVRVAVLVGRWSAFPFIFGISSRAAGTEGLARVARL